MLLRAQQALAARARHGAPAVVAPRHNCCCLARQLPGCWLPEAVWLVYLCLAGCCVVVWGRDS